MLGTAAAVALVVPSAAGAAKSYNNSSESQAGLCLIEGVVEVSCTTSESNAQNSGAESTSQATPLQVIVPINEKTCTAVGDPESGAVKVKMPESAVTPEDSPLTLLSSACEARAVKANVAESEADSTLLSASMEDAGSLTVAESHAESQANRGQSRSSAEFTLVDAEGGGMSLTVLHCESRTHATGGHPEGRTETEGTLISTDGQEQEDPGLCSLVVESSASKGDD